MVKGLKYIVVVILVIIIIWAVIKFYSSYNKTENNDNIIVNSTKVFEEPETIVYEVKGYKKFSLKKEDKEYDIILEKLNSSLIEGYTSKEDAYKNGYKLKLLIIDIEEEIYSKNSVLRLFYSDTYEIDIIFGEDKILDIIYVEKGVEADCFYGFDEIAKDRIKEYIDNI